MIHPSLSMDVERRIHAALANLPAQPALIGPDSPWFAPVDDLRAEAEASGHRFVSFAHYDYLGLGTDPRVTAAAHAAIATHGVGAGASRLIGGERSIHGLFERELADFLGVEATLATAAGYLTPLTMIPHLLGAGDMIIMDEFAHSSARHGAKATRARTEIFKHNDLNDLERRLRTSRNAAGACLILVEGLYSMEGDIADLPRLLDIRDRFGCWLMIDEAHSIGVLGDTGRGLCEHFGVDANRVDIISGTLSKTFAAQGGFVAARREVIDWLRYTLPGFVYSAGISPVIIEACRAALRVMIAEPRRVDRLARNSARFIKHVTAAGFETGEIHGRAIVPLLFDCPAATARVSRELARRGLYVPPIMHVAIGNGPSRLRFFLTAAHAPDDIDRVAAALCDIAGAELASPHG